MVARIKSLELKKTAAQTAGVGISSLQARLGLAGAAWGWGA